MADRRGRQTDLLGQAHQRKDQKQRLQEPVVTHGHDVQQRPVDHLVARARHDGLDHCEQRADGQHRQQQSMCLVKEGVDAAARAQPIDGSGQQRKQRHAHGCQRVAQHAQRAAVKLQAATGVCADHVVEHQHHAGQAAQVLNVVVLHARTEVGRPFRRSSRATAGLARRSRSLSPRSRSAVSSSSIRPAKALSTLVVSERSS